MSANEASAVASLRTYNTSIVAYQTTYGTDPDRALSQLGPNATPSSTSLDLVDSLLGAAAPIKSGYKFTYAVTAGTPVTQYTILAQPVSASTGQRNFFADQSGLIRANTLGFGHPAAVTDLLISG